MSSFEVSSGQYDVAIVGAGPVGATLAALLGQAGVSVFIGDANTQVYPLPRAAHFDHEIMRVFQQLEIAEKLGDSVLATRRYVFQNAAGDTLLDFDLGDSADTGWSSYMMFQPGVENALRARLNADANITLRTGVSFAKLQQEGSSVRTRWQSQDGEFELRSSYLVGCDGARSPVREAIGGKLEDLGFDEPWLVVDLIVSEQNSLPIHSLQMCDPQRPTTYVVMGSSRRRFEFMMLPGETAEQVLAEGFLEKLLEPWNPAGIVSVERKAVYRFHALIAEQWRSDRVLLAGDSAHQTPPFAGQGMCSGIRDAAALAWRLALVIKHQCSSNLLESYQIERAPHVRTMTLAAIETGRVVCTLDPAIAKERDRAMIAARAAGAPPPDISSPPIGARFGLEGCTLAGTRFFQPWTNLGGKVLRMDDVLGSGAWLIGKSTVSIETIPGLSQFGLDDDCMAPFREAVSEWLEQARAEAVLVRGDRYVFGVGDSASLADAYLDQIGLRQVVPLPVCNG